MPLRRVAALAAALAAAAAVAAPAQDDRPSKTTLRTGNGRALDPAGRMTPVGTFPRGGAITPDNRFYWTVDAGRHTAYVHIIDMATGAELQKLPIPGGDNGIAFSPDGTRAYVSGLAAEDDDQKTLPGAGGDVIHVYLIDPSGTAAEQAPIVLPDAADGAAASDTLPPSSGVKAWPQGLAVTPDGKTLVVVLGQADQVALVDLATGSAQLASVGRYPFAVAIDPRTPRAYVSNERDGTVSVLDLPSGQAVATIPVGGTLGPDYAHAEGLAVDPVRNRLYVAVADRDLLAVVDTTKLAVDGYVDLSRKPAPLGVAPVAVAVAPDGGTAYVADAGEDALAVVALADRAATGPQPHAVRRLRSVASIGRYRRALAHTHGTAARRKLRNRLLFGARAQACRGPSAKQDRRRARAILHAYAASDRARHRGVSRKRRQRAFRTAVRRAGHGLPKIRACRGGTAAIKALTLIGRIPTAAYPTDVEVSPNGKQLAWLAARGVGTGPRGPDDNIDNLLEGRAGILARPTDAALKKLTARADVAVVPSNQRVAPAGTPVRPDGPIKHVFFVVKENRTYDQILSDDSRGVGDPTRLMFGDNGGPAPTGGVTPNIHALVRRFPLLDSVYANSEESTVGHKVTTSAYANDYTQRKVAAGRSRKGDPDIYAIGVPPNAAIFDQAQRQGISYHVFGELGGGNQPFADNGRDTFDAVFANTDPTYPTQVQGTCLAVDAPNPSRCSADAAPLVTSSPGKTTQGAPAAQSRMGTFQTRFQEQLQSGSVPTLTYMILFNNHTNGTTPGFYTPKADVADNDLALGQLVDLVSHSSIWSSSAILVVEDDSQDGSDSVDAHRIPVAVISPYALKGAVVHTRYDQFSFLRTIELITGINPLSLNDALATPLYDAFVSGGEKPDTAPYDAIQPQQSLTEVNPAGAADARLSLALPWDLVDAVPQRLSDRILWHSVYGQNSTPPKPGPDASPEEADRARGALERYREHGRAAVRSYLAGDAD